MREWVTRLARRLRKRSFLRVAGAQPLAPGVTVYAIDVDGRRIIVGASARALCVLDRYPTPILENREGPRDPAA